MLIRPLIPVAILCLVLSPVRAQETAAPVTKKTLSPTTMSIVKEARENSQVMAHLDYLTNCIGPRLTGSDGLVRAAEWARDTFKSFGLTNCHLEAWGEAQVAFNRGPWFGTMHWQEGDKPQRYALTFNTLSYSAGTKGNERAKAILAPQNKEGFEAIKDQLAGAWLVGKPSSPRSRRYRRPRRPAPGTGNQRATPPATPKAPPFNLLKACLDAGVRGFVTRNRGDLLKTGMSREKGDWRKLTWENRPTIPSIRMLPADYKKIEVLLKKGTPLELAFNIQNRFRKGPIKLYNVVADIPGTEKPDEFVLVGGHLDCVGGATGAVDNGSGVATAMEAARLLSKCGCKPRRTIRFVLWGGEEEGLLGSRGYVKAHKEEMPKISAYLNHDSGTNYVSAILSTKAMKDDLDQVFAEVLDLDPKMPFKVQEVPGLRSGGSDHTSFLQAGVPGFFWRLSGRANYGYIWHTQHDNYDQVIPEYQIHSSQIIAIGALGIANLDNLLSREKMTAPRGRGRGRGRSFLGWSRKGLLLTAVAKNSIAARVGFKKDDTLQKIGDQVIKTENDLQRAFMQIFRGEGKTKILVLRGGKPVELSLGRSDIMRRRQGQRR